MGLLDKAATKVLDHGYVIGIESWGSDEAIIEAARMSTAKGFLGWGPLHSKECVEFGGLPKKHNFDCCFDAPGDEKLLKYLWDNKHSTPFEMAGLTIEIQAPIFVYREWHRHRTQSYSELSARYTPLPDFNYVPTVERCMMNAGTSNKQAGTIAGSDALTHERALTWLTHLEEAYQHCEDVYQEGLRWGIPKEVARLPVPVARYSRMRASANLRNWLAFLTLRSDKNLGAQWEIRQFANVVGNIIRDEFPRTHALFVG